MGFTDKFMEYLQIERIKSLNSVQYKRLTISATVVVFGLGALYLNSIAGNGPFGMITGPMTSVNQSPNIGQKVTAIVVKGKQVALLPNESQAKDVIQQVVDFFTKEKAEQGMTLQSYQIKDTIAYEEVDLPAGTTPLSIEDAVKKLTHPEQEVITYQVQPGDCISIIAEKTKTPMSVLLASNPGLVPERLQIGQALRLVKPTYDIDIETTYVLVQDEDIKFDTQEVKEESLGWSKPVIKQEGENGKKEARYLVVKHNGETVNQELQGETVLKPPVTRIVAKGDRYLVAARGGAGRFSWPTSSHLITSPFGMRDGKLHTGVDFGCPVGTSVAASADGVVRFAGWAGSYGKRIIVDHGGGVQTTYNHLSEILVGSGQKVNQGEVIARSGVTGNTTGPHLHFEVMTGGNFQNPMGYLGK
ncbi:peptidoglycan DD-metalloendopeptidase family protein [Heliobacillus mobilis]|uniref:Peptidoglycan DD-metalloendopeptidase family protein n=1 Tax=Heliobacterium mobile TaxID=28064 RepID=A0A6I3SNS0_HELMO|nr:M23 family metallopeptidase [Heliobacterium mobile]MTV50658.1 peptidoglycan DD-metalloendopeptidase family protein [Heliobacterium mobile]